jgi:hypothetical protein
MLSKLELRFLTLSERAQYVWDYGQYVSSRSEGYHKIHLYLLGSYYVDVIYNADSNRIVDVVPQDSFRSN